MSNHRTSSAKFSVSLQDALNQLSKRSDRTKARDTIIDGLQGGSMHAVTRCAEIEFPGSEGQVHLDWLVPSWLWESLDLPSISHPFWETGDLTIRPTKLPAQVSNILERKHLAIVDEDMFPTFRFSQISISDGGLKIIPKTGSLAKTGRGRKPGTGGYHQADISVVKEMRELILRGEAVSAWEAANLLTQKAAGGGTDRSKQVRLHNRYKDTFSD